MLQQKRAQVLLGRGQHRAPRRRLRPRGVREGRLWVERGPAASRPCPIAARELPVPKQLNPEASSAEAQDLTAQI